MGAGRELLYELVDLQTAEVGSLLTHNLSAAIRQAVGSFLELAGSGAGDEELKGWATERMGIAADLVHQACEVMGTPEVGIDLLSGVQGTGKEVNTAALSWAAERFFQEQDLSQVNRDLAALVGRRRHFGLITTGTGGIMVPPPSGEYQHLFSRLGSKVGELTQAGHLVPDGITSLCVYLLIARRISQGLSTVQIDTWPRTPGQYEHMNWLFTYLAQRGIATRFNATSLHLLEGDALARLANDRHGHYSAAAQEIGRTLRGLVQGGDETQRGGQLDSLIDSGSVAVKDFVHEVLNATRRVLKRAREQGRKGDADLKVIWTRLASFYENLPFVLSLPGVKFVSTLQAPDAVVADLVKAWLGNDKAFNEPDTQEFIKLAGQRAMAIVSGGVSTGKDAEA